MQEVLQDGKKRNNRISVLFIGQDRVGKTSLKRSLLGQSFNEQQESTVGIDIDCVEVEEREKSKPWKLSRDRQLLASEDYTNHEIGIEAAKRMNALLQQEVEYKEARTTGEKSTHGGGDGHKDGTERRQGNGDEIGHCERDVEDANLRDSLSVPHDPVPYRLREEMKQEIKKVDQYSNDMDVIRLFLCDVAGQSVFYDIHSIMMRLHSIFVLVVDLDKPPHAKAEPLFVDESLGKQIPCENYLVETNLDYANRWMSAIDTISECYGELEKSVSDEYNLPATILVLTKPDKLQGTPDQVNNKIKEVQKVLLNSFKKIKCDLHIVARYVIDNTCVSTGEEDDQIQQLREKIFKTAQAILKAQEETPMKWLRLERAFGIERRRGNPYITLERAREIGKQCKVIENFSAAINYLHEQNIIVHFDGNQPEKNLVVLDPRWLVKLLTKVLTVPPPADCSGKRASFWDDLTDNGKLDLAVRPSAMEEHQGQEDALVRIMVRANLICEWRENVYLVPSMVKLKFEEKKIQEVLAKCSHPSLYINFKHRCIPLGFYTRLQGKFAKWSCQDSNDVTAPAFYSNCCRFPKKATNTEYAVILIRHISRIQIAVKGTRS